ncbi:MAG: DUF815 domain-containing protein [Pseudomonadota bacterium]
MVIDRDDLTRIADALERLAPPRATADPQSAPAYRWDASGLAPLAHVDALPLDRLARIEAQKQAFLENARRHAAGRAAHDVLLWGARGMGKSALVKSVAVETDLILVAADGRDADRLPDLFAQLAPAPRRFLIFIDDLGVDETALLRALRSVLDGGLTARPDNCRLAVTSNRRHLVARRFTSDDEVNPRDAADDQLALAERFGLSRGFHAASQDDYLAMCRSLAAPLDIDKAEAIRFATTRGARSGRIAAHYVTELRGRG